MDPTITTEPRHLPRLAAATVSAGAMTAMSFSIAMAVSAAMASGASAVRRDPFWPLGYVPAATNVPLETVGKPDVPAPVVVATAVTAQDWEDAEREVGIRPVRYSVAGGGGGRNVVLVAGKIKAEGDLVLLERNGVRFSWSVASIGRDAVRFERRSAEILRP